jgi:hypothetical protein
VDLLLDQRRHRSAGLVSNTTRMRYGGGRRGRGWFHDSSCRGSPRQSQSSQQCVAEVFREQTVDVEGDRIVCNLQQVGYSAKHLKKSKFLTFCTCY